MGNYGKAPIATILPPFPLGKRVKLSDIGQAHFRELIQEYELPLDRGVVVGNYRNLVKVSNGEYSGWFANCFWEVAK